MILEGEFISETDKALYIEYKEKKYWLPKSHCSEIKREVDFENCNIKIILKLSDWLAYNKGLSPHKPINYKSYYNDYGHDENEYYAYDDLYDRDWI